MSMHVAQAKKKEEAPKNILKDVWFYDERGGRYSDLYRRDVKNNLVSELDHKRYAKAEIYTNGEVRCFIKRYGNGRVGETIVDPASILGSERDLRSFSDNFGERFAEYIKVNEDVFKTYTLYLQNRNPLYFTNVQRKYLNGESE